MSPGPPDPHGDQAEALREWLQGNHPAYSARPVRSGDWLSELAWAIEAARKLPPVELPHPGPWELWPRQGTFEIRPILYQPTLAAVAFYPRPESTVGIRQLWRWHRARVREAWFLESHGWKECDVLALLMQRVLNKSARFLLPGPLKRQIKPETRTRILLRLMRLFGRYGPLVIHHDDLATPPREVWPRWLAADNHQPAPVALRPGCYKVVQYVGALHAGGAERQLCNLAAGLHRRGNHVRVLTTNDLIGERGHYAELLKKLGVPFRQARAASLLPRHVEELPWHLLRATPSGLREALISLAAELAADPPDVLHCWLDQPNVIGAIAGLLAGIRCVVLSTRNSNPTNFPRLNLPFLLPWYRLVAQSRRVHFIANSRSGGASYAAWIGIPLARFHIVFNGIDLDHFPQPSPEARRAARKAHGIRETDRVVSGVFRLAEEKQPDVFLDVIQRVHAQVPALRVLLAGAGDLEDHVARRVRTEGMADYVQLLGRRSDVAAILLASDATLLTSKLEGTPNIALEAQYLGTPLVATAGGGTVDAVAHGATGFLANVGDVEALTEYLTRVLTDEALRQRLAAAGPGFIKERFSLEGMIERTLAVYEQSLGSAQSVAANGDNAPEPGNNNVGLRKAV
jgi:glycosyltransferase involved in cell wall biosynthesis